MALRRAKERRFKHTIWKEGFSAEEAQQRLAEAAGEYGVRELEEYTGGEPIGRLQRAEAWRPTSLHLRSALLVDQYGVEYTPASGDASSVFYVRMPKSASRRITRMLSEGETPDVSAVGLFCFPPPGTELELRRLHDKSVSGVMAVVRALDDVRTGSARVVLDAEVDVRHTPIEERVFARRREKNATALAELAAVAADAAAL